MLRKNMERGGRPQKKILEGRGLIIMTADRELVDDISEGEFVGFSREELVGFTKEELGIHPFGFGG